MSKGYGLPGYSGPKTLVFAVSYSGNTEETVAAYQEAAERRCPTICISAGGRLRELAAAGEGVHVDLPADVPMPRAALGYLAGAVLGVLARVDGPGKRCRTDRLLRHADQEQR